MTPGVRKLPERPAPGRGSLQLGAPRVEPDVVNLVSRVAAPARRPVVEPLAPTRYQVRFTASAELREKLQRVEAKRFGKTKAPRRELAETDTTLSSRHIPAAVRRPVARDHRQDVRLPPATPRPRAIAD